MYLKIFQLRDKMRDIEDIVTGARASYWSLKRIPQSLMGRSGKIYRHTKRDPFSPPPSQDGQ